MLSPIDVYDVLERAHATLTVESALGDGNFSIVAAQTDETPLPGSNLLFIGLISDVPFHSLRLIQLAPFEEDVIFIDRNPSLNPPPSPCSPLGYSASPGAK